VAVIDARVLAPFRPRTDRCRDDSGMRERPACVVLGVKGGVTPSPEPPVRIFLGTEPAQHRAERIFAWSIERVRDPSRVYEIHLMKELAGFDRRRWLTGFTNYRYAIPHFAGGVGRAIWNDVDEIYLADPAELFDTDMGDHGFLTIPRLGSKKRTDSSVMLIDCARMAAVWPLEAAQRQGSQSLLDRAVAIPGLHGDLDPEWNARDEEYVEGRSKLIHYTVLHTQPWQPLPRVFVYQRNPVGRVWTELERSADEAGYSVFSAARPSPPYTAMLERLRAARARGEGAESFESEPPGAEAGDVRAVAVGLKARTILAYGLGKEGGGDPEAKALASSYGVEGVTRHDLAVCEPGDGPPEPCDGVVCTEVLEYVPDEDVPWLIEELFAHARGFVYATLTDGPHAKVLPDGLRPRRRPGGRSWWYGYFEAASARHPHLHWRLAFHTRTAGKRRVAHLRKGGRRLDGAPTVWVLRDADAEHTDQSVALAEALGWPYEQKDLRSGALSRLPAGLGATRIGLDRTRSASLAPVWPDVVIAAGPRPSQAAREIGKRSRGHTRVVQLGREGGQSADPFDITVTYGHADLPADRRRIETVAPLSPLTSERLARAAEHLPGWFENAPRPRVVLWVGGSTAQHRLDGATALRLAQDVRAFAEDAGGCVVAVTSPRTGPGATDALELGLGASGTLRRWSPGQWESPSLGFLAAADAIVVTGESAFLLAQATATGKPVYIYSLPRRRLGLRQRLARSVAARARARPLNRRGTVRPQQGLEYLCARLIERAWIAPPPDASELHQGLIQRGAALPFGAPFAAENPDPLREAEDVARTLQRLLGS
jgi:mitochondrial fission protein ELM1